MDSLRGYFLVLMTLAHLPDHPLGPSTSYTFGYASAPDGFVFLSGLVSTWVYLRQRDKHGHPAMRTRILRRTRDIYLVHIFLLAIGIMGAVLSNGATFHVRHPMLSFARGCLLLSQPKWCDILPMYCVFLLFTPLALDQFMKGRAWLVGAVSATLWLAAQAGIGDASSRLVPWIDVGAFNILAWQAYFVAGQYIGYRQLYKRDSAVPRSRWLLAVCTTLSLVFFLDRHLHFIFGAAPLLGFSEAPDRNPARFLDAACLAYMIWWVPRGVDQKLARIRWFGFLELLGQHSLQVFAFSLLMTSTWAVLGPRYWADLSGPTQVALAVVTVLALFIPARLHDMYRQLRSRGLPAALRYPPLRQSEPA